MKPGKNIDYIVNPMPQQISEAQRAELMSLDTGTIGHHLDSGFMDPGLAQQIPGTKIAGTAVTVKLTTPDSVMAHYALKFTRPGDILVIDRGQDQRVACWGAATSFAAAKTGLVGVMIDGASNDIADAKAAGLAMWSRGVSPVTTKYRSLGGELNVPVCCGGVPVNPGDAILADDNGVVVIRPDDVDSVIAAGKKWQSAEREFLKMLSEDPTLVYPDLTGASKIVEENLKSQKS